MRERVAATVEGQSARAQINTMLRLAFIGAGGGVGAVLANYLLRIS